MNFLFKTTIGRIIAFSAVAVAFIVAIAPSGQNVHVDQHENESTIAKATTDDALVKVAPKYDPNEAEYLALHQQNGDTPLSPVKGCSINEDMDKFVAKATTPGFPESRKIAAEALLALVGASYSSPLVHAECVIDFAENIHDTSVDDILSRAKKAVDSYPKASLEGLAGAKKLRSILEEAKGKMDELKEIASKYKIITGVMVGELSERRYEVKSPYSNERLILNTTKTTFSSKGLFRMPTKYQGTTQVQLSRDAGGFTANWGTYEEVDQAEWSQAQTSYIAATKGYKELKRSIPQVEKEATAFANEIFAKIKNSGRTVASKPSK